MITTARLRIPENSRYWVSAEICASAIRNPHYYVERESARIGIKAL